MDDLPGLSILLYLPAMPINLLHALRHLPALVTLAVLASCATSPDLAKHGKVVVKATDPFPDKKLVYYQPVELESELARNVKKFLAQNRAQSVTCVYTGTYQKSKNLTDGVYDPSQKRSGIARVEKTYQMGGGFFRADKSRVVGLSCKVWINGQLAGDIYPHMHSMQTDGDAILRQQGEKILLFSSMLELLPTLSIRVSDSFGPHTVTPNAGVEFDPVSQKRLSCARFRKSSQAHAGEIVDEAMVSDEVPGRVVTLREKMHGLHELSVRLSSVTYH